MKIVDCLKNSYHPVESLVCFSNSNKKKLPDGVLNRCFERAVISPFRDNQFCLTKECLDLKNRSSLLAELTGTYSMISNNIIQPNVHSFNKMINGFMNINMFTIVDDLLDEMGDYNIKFNHLTYSLLIDSHVKKNNKVEAIEVFKNMIDEGDFPHSDVLKSVLTAFTTDPKEKEIKELDKIYHDYIDYFNTEAFNLLLKNYSLRLNTELFKDKYTEMFDGSVIPDYKTFSILYKKLSKLEVNLIASSVLDKMIDRNQPPEKKLISFLKDIFRHQKNTSDLNRLLELCGQ